MKSYSFFFIVVLLFTGCSSHQKNNMVISSHVHQKSIGILIAIKPYHGVSKDLVDLVARELEDFYQVKTIVLSEGEMPDSCRKPYAKRYNANKILQFLPGEKPDTIPFILALTTRGIAIKKEPYKEWGILGLGSRPGPVCVVSTANMGKNPTRLKDRLVKVCLHEMGHNFGLPHCEQGDKRCLMRSANGTVKTVDEEKKFLCKHCSGYLKNLGFNLKNNS